MMIKTGEVLYQFKYTHDPVGNITQIEKHRVGIEADNGIFKYTYDPLNRLVEASNNQGSKKYEYDSLGNRISQLVSGTNRLTEYSYNARNQLIKTLEGEVETNYSYDKRGNLIGMMENGLETARYKFDATNMMVSAVTDRGGVSYGYDGFRNRVRKIENLDQGNVPDPIKEVRYVLDFTLPYDNLLMTKGAEDQSFTWGTSLLSGADASTSTFYYLQDHLGSPVRLLGQGDNQETLAYDEFGVPEVGATSGLGGFGNPFGFTGYQVEDVSGLWYAQARYYNPGAGRFSAEDPINNGFNWYSYCASNPIILVDPDGLVEVPLVCYAETYNGANVTWNNNNTIATVQYGQRSFSVESTPQNTRNGVVYVDNSIFIENFGVGSEPVVIFQHGYNVSIRANFNFTTNVSMRDLPSTNRNPNQFISCATFLNGVESNLSGEFGDFQVSMNASRGSNGIPVVLNASKGVSNLTVRGGPFDMFISASRYWSNSNRGTIYMFEGDSSTNHWYSEIDFMWVSAHEFVHALGVADAYVDRFTPSDIASIMNSFGDSTSESDIRMILNAWNTGQWQTWDLSGISTPQTPLKLSRPKEC